MRFALWVAVCAAMAGLVAGCGVHSDTRWAGGSPDAVEPTIKRIKDGESSVAELFAALGRPDEEQEVGGVTVLRYTFTRRDRSDVDIFLLWNSESDTTTRFHHFFKVNEDGTIVDHWKSKSLVRSKMDT